MQLRRRRIGVGERVAIKHGRGADTRRACHLGWVAGPTLSVGPRRGDCGGNCAGAALVREGAGVAVAPNRLYPYHFGDDERDAAMQDCGVEKGRSPANPVLPLNSGRPDYLYWLSCRTGVGNHIGCSPFTLGRQAVPD